MENPMNIDDVMRKYRMSIDDVLNVPQYTQAGFVV